MECGGRAGGGLWALGWLSWKEGGRCGPELPIDPAGDNCWGLRRYNIDGIFMIVLEKRNKN